jgi:hypothetical protein
MSRTTRLVSGHDSIIKRATTFVGQFLSINSKRRKRRSKLLEVVFNQSTQLQKPQCIFYGESKGHTAKTYQITIKSKKNLSSQRNLANPRRFFLASSYYSPYIPQHVQYKKPKPQPSVSTTSVNPQPSHWGAP